MHLFFFLVSLLNPIGVSTRGVERPIITEIEPRSVMQDTDFFRDEWIPVTIIGYNLYPRDTYKYRYNELRVQVLLRRSQGGYIQLREPLRGRQGELQTLKTTFRARDFLKETGTLSIMVKVDSKGSIPYTIAILPPPRSRPQIRSIVPSTFPVNQGPFSFRIYANELDSQEHMNLKIGNIPVPLDYLDLRSGILEATIPTIFWNRMGTYKVQLYTRKGASMVQYIGIKEPDDQMPPSVGVPIEEFDTKQPIYPIPKQLYNYPDRMHQRPPRVIRKLPTGEIRSIRSEGGS